MRLTRRYVNTPLGLRHEADNVKAKTTSGLMKLPAEIRQKIFALAVSVAEPVTPIQVKPRSNKFFWTKSQYFSNRNPKEVKEEVVQGQVFGIPQLTVVQLSKVSRQIYAEAIQTNLFYRVNQFKFLTVSDMVTYLAAVTPNHMAEIRSIEAPLPLGNVYADAGGRYVNVSAPAYTLLGACKGLRNLELRVDSLVYHHDYFAKSLPLLNSEVLQTAVRGLKTLSVVINQQPLPEGAVPFTPTAEDESRLRKFRDNLESTLQAEIHHKRGFKYPVLSLREARSAAGLDIEGTGRIDSNIRPGATTGRTRQQLNRLENIDSDGTLPERTTPMHHLDGSLAWTIRKVLDSREIPDGVEFLITVRCPSIHYRSLNSRYGKMDGENNAPVTEITVWEHASHLSPNYDVVLFYDKNPNAYGKRLVLDMWKAACGSKTSDDNLGRVKKAMNGPTSSLNVMVKRDIRLEKQAEEKAANRARAEARTVARALARANAKASAKASAQAHAQARAKASGKGAKGRARATGKVSKGKSTNGSRASA